MAIKKVYDLSVDLKRTRIKANVPVLVQGDSTEFRLRLLENGKELTPGQISGVTSVELLSGYDAQTIIRTVGTMQGSEAVFSIEQGELFKTGQVKAMVRLADADDRISTLNFEYQVISDLTANYIPGEQDVSIFQQYIADAQQKIDEMAATDVQQLSAQLAETVKKEEPSSISWAMAKQDFRENITGGNTAVVGIDSVLPENIVSGGATFDKRTRLGDFANIILGSTTNTPNINIAAKTITFDNTFFVVVGKKRYTVTNGAVINYTDAVQFTPNPVIYFDTATSTFIARPQNGTDSATVPESAVLFALLVFKAGTLLTDVFLNCRYTVNGINSNVFFMDEQTINLVNYQLGELPLISVSSSGQLPDLRIPEKQVAFPSTFFIFHRNQRYTVTNGATLNFGEAYPTQSGVKLWFDTANQSIYMTNQTSTGGTTNTSIMLGLVYLVGNQWKLNINSDYTYNGKPLYAPYQTPKGEQTYRFSLDKVSGSATDSDLLGIGEAGSPFDYTNDNHELVYGLFDDLQADAPNYIQKNVLGNVHNGLPVNEYQFIPVRPVHSTVKPYPKILIGAAVHGGEGLAVATLYYMMKRITQEWQTDERLDYLRHNLNLKIVPLRNPGAYNEKLYVYPNGVNINRNFSYGHASSTDPTKGTAPFSELETQVQRDWLMANDDALFQIDCHVRGARQIVTDDKIMWLSCSNEEQAEIAAHTIGTMNKRWHQKYPQLSNTQMLGYLTTGEANGTIRSYSYQELGIPTVTWEGFSRSTTMSGMEDKDVVDMNVDYMIQFLVDIVKKYQDA